MTVYFLLKTGHKFHAESHYRLAAIRDRRFSLFKRAFFLFFLFFNIIIMMYDSPPPLLGAAKHFDVRRI